MGREGSCQTGPHHGEVGGGGSHAFYPPRTVRDTSPTRRPPTRERRGVAPRRLAVPEWGGPRGRGPVGGRGEESRMQTPPARMVGSGLWLCSGGAPGAPPCIPRVPGCRHGNRIPPRCGPVPPFKVGRGGSRLADPKVGGGTVCTVRGGGWVARVLCVSPLLVWTRVGEEPTRSLNVGCSRPRGAGGAASPHDTNGGGGGTCAHCTCVHADIPPPRCVCMCRCARCPPRTGVSVPTRVSELPWGFAQPCPTQHLRTPTPVLLLSAALGGHGDPWTLGVSMPGPVLPPSPPPPPATTCHTHRHMPQHTPWHTRAHLPAGAIPL